MTHGRGRGATAILEPLATALRTIDAESAAVFGQFVDSCLADAEAREIWRDLMAETHYFFRHPVAEKVREEGREEGRVEDRGEMTLRILEWRRIPVPESVRERVLACDSLERLETWAQRAVHAVRAEDLFLGEDDEG